MSSTAIVEIIAERDRQILDEGLTAEHDDDHECGELARAAAAYATHAHRPFLASATWPFDGVLKDKGHRRNCVCAAALLIAEIERLDRLSLEAEGPTT